MIQLSIKSKLFFGAALAGAIGFVACGDSVPCGDSIGGGGAVTGGDCVDTSDATVDVRTDARPDAVSDVVVTDVTGEAAPNSFSLGGSITGYLGTGLVIENGAESLPVAKGASTYALATKLSSGTAYAIKIKTQPTSPSQTCVVANGTGIIGSANITNANVTCTTDTFTITAAINGLKNDGLVLQNNAGDDLTVPANADGGLSTSATFATKIASGANYAVTIKTQPADQTCTIAGATGTVVSGNITTVTVTCTNKRYMVGGTVAGLAGAGLVVQNSLGDDATVNANGTYSFATPLETGTAYSVTVKTQPTSPWQTCTVANPTGTISASDVTNANITCTTNSYFVGGTVSGLVGTGLVLQNNGGDNLAIGGNGFGNFATKVLSGDAYAVTVASQPTSPSQTCVVANAAGVVMGTDVSNVTVVCTTNQYTVSATVSGLAGSGLVLQNNGGDNVAANADGTFTFPTAIDSGAGYNVTVLTQPSNLSQTCTVTNGSGTIGAGNVVNVSVACVTNSFTVGGTVSGLVGSGLVLQNNSGNNLAIGGNGAFTFSSAVLSGGAYAVSVLTNPSVPTQTCVVTNGSGTVTASNITGVSVVCTTNTYTVGGNVAGLTAGTLVLRNNGGNDLSLTADGGFTFSAPVASGGAYAVTVQTQPAGGLTCTVASGSGTVVNANITNVSVTCVLPTSCVAIKQANPSAADGNYTVDIDGVGPRSPITVFCDMTTDGGGYLSYAISGGIPTTRFDQANSCTALGMNIAIPRTKAHLTALHTKYGAGYFQTVPGVYGLAAVNHSGQVFNSNNPTVAANWKALDGKSWFAKDTAHSEPNGDYVPGCWLATYGPGTLDGSGFQGWNDGNCDYSTGATYVCSDNVKDAPLCSVAATKWCTDKGWTASPVNLSNGSIYCTAPGTSPGDNCNTAATWNLVVWKNGAQEPFCPGTYSTTKGSYYGAHSPCTCGNNLLPGGTWDTSCVPDP